MKLKVISVMILFLGTFLAGPVQGDYSKYVDAEGQVSDLVVKCLNLSGIAIEGEGEEKSMKQPIFTLKSRALKDVVDLVQGRTDPDVSWWNKGGERWTMFNPLLTLPVARQIVSLGLEEFKFNEPVYPKEGRYEGLLILGSDAAGVHDRVLFSNELINRGTKVKTVYILTGKRKLEDFEKKDFPYLTSDDEGQMALEILQKEALPALQKSNVLIYSEPPEGSPRATTESTVEAFMEVSPKRGNYLCVSDGIFIPYQELVIQNTLDKYYPDSGIKVQCVGPAEDTFETARDEQMLNSASVFLDNLSRILYNLEKRQENKHAPS